MWVDLLYTDVLSLPSSFGVIRMSKKGMEPSPPGIFTGKLNVRIYGIYMNQEAASVGSFDDGESIIHICFSQRRGAW